MILSPMSPVEFKKCPCPLSLSGPCHMLNLIKSPCRRVDFKKGPCRPINSKGLDPYSLRRGYSRLWVPYRGSLGRTEGLSLAQPWMCNSPREGILKNFSQRRFKGDIRILLFDHVTSPLMLARFCRPVKTLSHVRVKGRLR